MQRFIKYPVKLRELIQIEDEESLSTVCLISSTDVCFTLHAVPHRDEKYIYPASKQTLSENN